MSLRASRPSPKSLFIPYTTIPMNTTTTLLLGYAAVEASFYFIYKFYFIPRANRRTEPRDYRDYGRHRHKLLIRILERMERTCRATNQNIHLWLEGFLLQWFHRDGTVENPWVLPPLKRISRSSLSSSPEGSDQEEDATTDWTMEGLNLFGGILPQLCGLRFYL
jgi:hypothetical protein